MEYTEEIKKEADSVVEKYKKLTTYKYQEYAGANPSTFEHDKDTLYTLAIQDRQSVLELAEIALEDANWTVVDFWSNKVQSLTQQIDYLKSKL